MLPQGETVMEQDPHGDQPPASEPDPPELEHRIRQRAHEIWLDEGKPEGRAHVHWLRARWELENAPDPKAEVAPGRKM